MRFRFGSLLVGERAESGAAIECERQRQEQRVRERERERAMAEMVTFCAARRREGAIRAARGNARKLFGGA